MLITPHVVLGAAIGSKIDNPYLIAPIALGSHFLLDKIPHWQETLYPYEPTKLTYIRILLDIILSIGILYFLAKIIPFQANIYIGIFFSLLPDMDALAMKYRNLLKINFIKIYYNWHVKIQNETDKFYGVITQIGIVLACIFILYFSQ